MSIELGYISGCFGVQGWLKVFSYCEPRNNIFQYPKWRLNGIFIEIAHNKINSKNLIVKFANINSKDDAECLVGKIITVDNLPDLNNDEFYWSQLIGLTVINLEKTTLGTVQELLSTGANDVLVIKNNGKRLLIPYTFGTHILAVDLLKQTITVNWLVDECFE